MKFLCSVVLLLSLPSSVVARDIFNTEIVPDFIAPADPVRRAVRGAPKKMPKRQHRMNGGMMKMDKKQKQPVAKDAIKAVVQDQKPSFDFIVAGFPKCGTTSLLKAFAAHDETDMANHEQCAVAAPNKPDNRVLKDLDMTLATLSSDAHTKRSFKCPTTMYNYKSISRMEKHSPNAKYVIGMRHPVEMLQSFYNYRITEIKERNLDEPIPSLEEVLESGNPWKGVSMQSTRFELFLMQLGKTSISVDQLNDLVGQNYELAIRPSNAPVFLYTVDQLEDTDETRSESFRSTMQSFLGLQKPIAAVGHENKNHVAHAHAESIDICHAKWASVRAKLVEQGTETARWLREEFIHSNDVVVGNQEHFIKTLDSWSVDPCALSAST